MFLGWGQCQHKQQRWFGKHLFDLVSQSWSFPCPNMRSPVSFKLLAESQPNHLTSLLLVQVMWDTFSWYHPNWFLFIFVCCLCYGKFNRTVLEGKNEHCMWICIWILSICFQDGETINHGLNVKNETKRHTCWVALILWNDNFGACQSLNKDWRYTHYTKECVQLSSSNALRASAKEELQSITTTSQEDIASKCPSWSAM